jgi:hypothetical protein
MKKIATLFFFTAIFASAFAQTKNRDWDDRNTNGNPNWNSNSNQVYQNDRARDHDRDRGDRYDHQYGNQNNSIAQRDMQIQRISQQYDYRIQQIKSDRSLSRREKRNAVNSLEAQKIQQINYVNSQYNSSVYNNGYSRNNDYKQNNRYNSNRRDNDRDNDRDDYNRYNK